MTPALSTAPFPATTVPSPAPPPPSHRILRRILTTLFVLAILGAGGYAAYRFRPGQSAEILPSAPARQGDFLVIIRCRGELKAQRSAPIYTPMIPNLRIAWLASPGDLVKEGDVIVKFDSSSSAQQLMQKEAALRQAQATLDQALAQAKITAEQDKTDLADAQFTVERARLEASKQEIVSRIQGEQSKVDLGVAEQKLKVTDATVALHAASDKSKIASLTRQRDAAQADVDLMKSRLTQMELKAPVSGVITLGFNYSQGWMNAKQFKAGDNVYSGMVLAEIPDLSTLMMDAKVEEIDRGRISTSQDVHVRVDSLPELTIDAKIGQISLLAETGNEFPAVRNFRAYSYLTKPDPRLRPGMNGGMDIITSRIPNAISIPAKALYTRAGKPIVYLANKGTYRPTEVEVLARNPDEVAVKGLKSGEMVTLVDPEKKESKK
jgi:multidrug efflux pump subunit AcrA (membrane-fusion protein)